LILKRKVTVSLALPVLHCIYPFPGFDNGPGFGPPIQIPCNDVPQAATPDRTRASFIQYDLQFILLLETSEVELTDEPEVGFGFETL